MLKNFSLSLNLTRYGNIEFVSCCYHRHSPILLLLYYVILDPSHLIWKWRYLNRPSEQKRNSNNKMACPKMAMLQFHWTKFTNNCHHSCEFEFFSNYVSHDFCRHTKTSRELKKIKEKRLHNSAQRAHYYRYIHPSFCLLSSFRLFGRPLYLKRQLQISPLSSR